MLRKGAVCPPFLLYILQWIFRRLVIYSPNIAKAKYKIKMQYILDISGNAIYNLHQKDGNTKEGRT